MQISFTNEVESGRVLYPLGRVQASASWHGAALASDGEDYRKAALDALKGR